MQYSLFTPRVLSDMTVDGMRHITVAPQHVCCSQIDVDIKDDTVVRVRFTNGCAGNTQGVAALIAGMNVEEASRRICGIDCHGKGTSCPDQLGQVLKYALENK